MQVIASVTLRQELLFFFLIHLKRRHRVNAHSRSQATVKRYTLLIGYYRFSSALHWLYFLRETNEMIGLT